MDRGEHEHLRIKAETGSFDWFLPAIHAVGSLGQCFGAVLTELDQRQSFIRALQNKLVKEGYSQDNLTNLGQRTRMLENTLKVRLGVLNPEREASWFRISPTQTAGPFASTILAESVFFPYQTAEWKIVRAQILNCWQSGQLYQSNSAETRQCLWSLLISLNQEFIALTNLPPPFQHLSLLRLPDDLPPAIESKSLRAFLINIRNEVFAIRQRLDASYQSLWAASEKLWSCQEKSAKNARTEFRNDHADNMREEFKRRRHHNRETQLSKIESQRQESLKFMGFTTHPGERALKHRYLEMAQSLHPDREGGDEAGFKNLTIAYGLLSSRPSHHR